MTLPRSAHQRPLHLGTTTEKAEETAMLAGILQELASVLSTGFFPGHEPHLLVFPGTVIEHRGVFAGLCFQGA